MMEGGEEGVAEGSMQDNAARRELVLLWEQTSDRCNQLFELTA